MRSINANVKNGDAKPLVPEVNEKQSTPVMEFGVPKTDALQSSPKMPFQATKGSENPTLLFSFGNNQKSVENSKPTGPVKFQFGSPKSDSNTSLTESTNAVFWSNPQNKNLFIFGKTDNTTLPTGNPPKYDATTEKSTPKFQFGALPTPVFRESTADQLKPQFNTPVSQSAIDQGPKFVFGSHSAENKPSDTGMFFAKNTSNSIFKFGSKLGDKPFDAPSSSFPFTSYNTTPAFGASAPQDLRDKPAFQFSVPAPKPSESVTNSSTVVSDSSKINDNNLNVLFGTGKSTGNSRRCVLYTMGDISTEQRSSIMAGTLKPREVILGPTIEIWLPKNKDGKCPYMRPYDPEIDGHISPIVCAVRCNTTTASPFQFGQGSSSLSTPQFGGAQPNQVISSEQDFGNVKDGNQSDTP